MKRLLITHPVEIALRSLDSESVHQVQTWFERMKNWEADRFVRSRSHLLDGFPHTYVLRTNTDLRVFFRLDGDAITVLDIANKSTILASGGITEAN